MLIHVIADFGATDLAFAEVSQRLKYYLPAAELVHISVPPFATLAAGFCMAQLGLNTAPDDMLIFHNVAPRKDNTERRNNNDGERLAYARLPNGVQVVGVHAGYAFSFIKDVATDLRYVNCASAGSQFRSRDIFPQAFAAVATGQADALAEELAASAIPAVPDSHIAYIDGFGNIKTTLTSVAQYPEGSSLTIKIGTVSREAIVSDGSFSVPQGVLALSPGSSGWQGESGASIRWTELFLRGGSAAQAFNHPALNEEIHITNSLE